VAARAVTVAETVQNSEIVVVAVPMALVSSLPKHLFRDAPKSLIVIDTSNYYPRQRDGLIEQVEAGMTESGWVEGQLGHPVIKVFNTIRADSLLNKGKPGGDAGRVALAVAGTMCKRKQPSCGLSTISDLTPSTRDRSSSLGASSPALRDT
jgi:8-hydroxy-5-deazaflavin:NADPH oxidoreductase